MNSIEEFNKTIAAINLLFPQVASLITLGDAAIRALWGIWSNANPGKTFDEFITTLRADSAEVKALAGEQLTARGFVQGADGEWYKPVVAPPLPV